MPLPDLEHFSAKVPVDITWSRFRIKTVANADELEAVLRLRHEVFYRELLGREAPESVDVDDYDRICDHLIIIDRASGRLIGTYRFISTAFSDRFYSQSEFAMDDLLAKPGVKLEMGRACIHADFRNGFTFIALWKGLAAYIAAHRVSYLFGCSSVKTENVEEVARMCDYLQRKGLWSEEHRAEPVAAFTMPGLSEELERLQGIDLAERAARDDALQEAIPALLWAYLDAGARLCGSPALDRDFHCIDFLTVLHTDNLREDLIRKYKPW
jgi:putative hemolysin